jgi:hypothetical protein
MERSAAALKMTSYDSKRICQEPMSSVQLNFLSTGVCITKELHGMTNLLSPDLSRQQTIENYVIPYLPWNNMYVMLAF